MIRSIENSRAPLKTQSQTLFTPLGAGAKRQSQRFLEVPSIIAILFFTTLHASSQHTDYLNYYEIGDTLTVLAKSGLTLRDGQSTYSRAIATMPFGSTVIALAGPGQGEERDGRIGCWIMVRFGNKEGHAFSGYMTKMKLPGFEVDPVYFCYNLQWFESVARANADSLVYKGYSLWKGFDLDGKDWRSSNWEVYKDGMIIHATLGYESGGIVIETSLMTMNDILNILEYYVSLLKQKCPDEWYMKEGSQLEITITRSEHRIEKIECNDMYFTARNLGLKNIISFSLWDL